MQVAWQKESAAVASDIMVVAVANPQDYVSFGAEWEHCMTGV